MLETETKEGILLGIHQHEHQTDTHEFCLSDDSLDQLKPLGPLFTICQSSWRFMD